MPRARVKPETPDLSGLMVNSAMLASVLNISARRVQQLAAVGTIPAATAYRYPLVESVQGYIRFLQQVVAQQGSGGSNSELKAARIALLRAQKKSHDLAYRQKTAQLLSIDDVEAMMLEIAATFAGQKRSMGSRLAGKLAGMTDPKKILALLNRENDAILRTVSANFAIGAKRR